MCPHAAPTSPARPPRTDPRLSDRPTHGALAPSPQPSSFHQQSSGRTVLGQSPSPVGEYVGTGMHAGTIYVRGAIEPWQLGAEVGRDEMSDADWDYLGGIIADYAVCFDLDLSHLQRADFIKLVPHTSRPYGTLYAY